MQLYLCKLEWGDVVCRVISFSLCGQTTSLAHVAMIQAAVRLKRSRTCLKLIDGQKDQWQSDNTLLQTV